METYVDEPYYPFNEETTDAMKGKEFLFVALGTAEGTIKVATAANDVIGVLYKRQAGTGRCTVRLLGGGGTVKVMAGGVVAKNATVGWGTGGKAVALATGNTLGRKFTHGSSAANDIIEIHDIARTIA